MMRFSRHLVAVCTATVIVSCATAPIQQASVTPVADIAALSQSQQIHSQDTHIGSATDVAQIGAAPGNVSTSQIAPNADIPQLTVEQLKTYADRCAPGRYAPNSNIDCSELSLRVRRVFQSEDKVAEALITLNRMGRTAESKSVDDELGRNKGDLSYSAQAVASGALDSLPPTAQDQPVVSDELESFLNEIGLDVNAGAIVQPGGG